MKRRATQAYISLAFYEIDVRRVSLKFASDSARHGMQLVA